MFIENRDYYTFSNEHALKMKKEELARLEKYPNLAAGIIKNSSIYSEQIQEIKKYGIIKIENLFDRNFILNLGKKLEKNIINLLPSMKVRNHKQEIKKNNHLFDRIYTQLPKEADFEDARKITSGIAIDDPFINIPDFFNILSNKDFQGIITGFYESIPLLTFAKARIGFASDWNTNGTDTQLWHRDIGSFRILKALIYLNDVASSGGPFEYIKSSHVQTFGVQDNNLRYEEQTLKEYYNHENFMSCVGNAGDVIFCDTSGIHRGKPIISDDRLILILTFCVHEEITPIPYEKIKAKKQFLKKQDLITQALFDENQII